MTAAKKTFDAGALFDGGPVERLLVLFGDQLDTSSPVLERLDRGRDAILMMEVAEEALHVPSHAQRTVLFLAAMRHAALELSRQGFRVAYVPLDHPDNEGSFDAELGRAVTRLAPRELWTMRPGEWRVARMIESWRDLDVETVELENPHFLTTPDEFAEFAHGRSALRLETFYRHVRRRLGLLVDADGKPEGGRWNFDKENRKRHSGAPIPPPLRFRPDDVTRDVIETVTTRFPEAPGTAESFDWPVSRRDAKAALDQFVSDRLPFFGDFQDAMVAGEPWMYHSLLSPALNLGLLDPRECVSAAIGAHGRGDAPLNAVEGFIRQIVGWREFLRGIYWTHGSDYADRNGLDADHPLPSFYWDGETEMACMRDAVGQVLRHGYGHHIQRLMVTGNFALLAGVAPREVDDWYLGMYVDGVAQFTTPNVVGMALHADGGAVGSKPYAASGKYVDRMSDHCRGCRFRPDVRSGDEACPFTTLYWDFLIRHETKFAKNPRMKLMLGHVRRMNGEEREAIATSAQRIRNEGNV